MIVSPPRLVGTRTVAPLFGVKPEQLRDRLAAGDPFVHTGYLGKIGARHIWNLHELVASLFTGEAALDLVVDRLTTGHLDPLDTVLCAAPDCDRIEEMVGLCGLHLRRLINSWRHASRSSLVTVQLVAMCRWVVDRNAHLVLPADYDPWSTLCMTPGCENPTNQDGWHGPLCPTCSAVFWQNSPDRERPKFWKGQAA